MNLIIKLTRLLKMRKQSSLIWLDLKWIFMNLIRSFGFHYQRRKNRFQDWLLFQVQWRVMSIREVLLIIWFLQLRPRSINILLKVLYVLKVLSEQYDLWYQQFVQDRIKLVSKNVRRSIKVLVYSQYEGQDIASNSLVSNFLSRLKLHSDWCKSLFHLIQHFSLQ